MVSLLAQTDSPPVEGRMTENKGKVALEQAISMMVAVSHSSFRGILLVFSSVMSSLIAFSLLIVGRNGCGLGPLGLLETP